MEDDKKEAKKKIETVEESPELEFIANKLLEGNKNGVLASNLKGKMPKIKYLLSTTLRKNAGLCTLAGPVWKKLASIDYVITVQKAFWTEAPQDRREALVLHELKHIIWRDPKVDPDTDREIRPGKWALLGHDIEEFVDVVAKYGAWEEGLKSLVRAVDAYEGRTPNV